MLLAEFQFLNVLAEYFALARYKMWKYDDVNNLFWQMEMVALHWVRCLVRHFRLQVMVVCCQRILCRCKGMKCLAGRTLQVAAFPLSAQHLEPMIFQGQQHFKNWDYHLTDLYLRHGFINCNFLTALFWIVWFLFCKLFDCNWTFVER